jgi:hypothetical protein
MAARLLGECVDLPLRDARCEQPAGRSLDDAGGGTSRNGALVALVLTEHRPAAAGIRTV